MDKQGHTNQSTILANGDCVEQEENEIFWKLGNDH